MFTIYLLMRFSCVFTEHMAGHLSEAFRAIFPCCRNFHALCRPPDAKRQPAVLFIQPLPLSLSLCIFLRYRVHRILSLKKSFERRILAVIFNGEDLCQIKAQYSEKRLRVDDHTVIKYIYIKIAAACDADKLLRLVCGHKFLLFSVSS